MLPNFRKFKSMTVKSGILSKPVLDKIHQRLGVGGYRDSDGTRDQSLSLLQHTGDHVWVWSSLSQEILVTGSAELQTIRLDTCPDHDVTCLTVTRSGLWAAVWGPAGVTVLQCPPRAGGRIGGGKETLTARSISLQVDSEVQSVSWHPGSAAECHLVILTRSGVITLYNVSQIDDRMEILSCQVTQSSPSKVSTALGEVPVDFCFSNQPGEAGAWPMFVLLANNDVYCVDASLQQESWSVEGPLEIRPPLDDNYSDGEACSVCYVGGVLAIATVQGVIYHGIVLGGDTTSLHMYERVELELGVVTSHDDVFSCPVQLVPHHTMLQCQPGYLASHPAGLHNVHLPMVTVLKHADTDTPDLEAGASVVEHLICTRPTSSAPPAPVLGACLAWPPCTVLCLMSSNTVTCLQLPSLAQQSADSILECQSSDDSVTRHQADTQLMSLLTRKCSQPLIMSSASTDLSPAVTLELLSSATQTLSREYIARLQVGDSYQLLPLKSVYCDTNKLSR